MRIFTWINAWLLVLVLSMVPVLAGPLEDAERAVQAERYTEAAELLEPLASEGNVEAQSYLGGLYLQGKGVEQDFVMARDLLERAAASGDARAQFGLGLIYAQGLGTAADPAKAVALYRKAAEQGLPSAEYSLATASLSGFGVPRDYLQAFIWFRRAADDGVSDAYYLLGWMYEIGTSDVADPIQAARWYYNAIAFRDYRALVGIGRLAADNRLRVGVPNKEVAFASFSLARELLTGRDAAEATERLDDLKATMTQVELSAGAKRYQDALGSGIEAYRQPNTCIFVDIMIFYRDRDEHTANCRRLAALGMPVAVYGLGWTLPVQEGNEWLQLAATSDFPAAQLVLGQRLSSGDGMDKDLAQALGWLMVAELRLRLPDLPDNYREDAARQVSALAMEATSDEYIRAADWAKQWNAAHPVRPLPEALKLYEDALVLLNDQNGQAAKTLLDRALEIDPRFALAFLRRSEARMMLGDLVGGRADAVAALAVDPANAAAHFELGQLDRLEGNHAEAVTELSAFLASEEVPSGATAPALDMRAASYRALGDYERALADDNRAIKLSPPSPQLLMSRGLDYFLLNRFEESAEDFHMVAGGAPGTPRYAALWEFISLGHAGKDGSAVLTRAVAAPSDRNWPFAVLRFYLGQMSQGGLMGSALKPEHKCEARYYIGELKLIDGDTAGARKMFERALEICPKDATERLRAEHLLQRLVNDAALAN